MGTAIAYYIAKQQTTKLDVKTITEKASNFFNEFEEDSGQDYGETIEIV